MWWSDYDLRYWLQLARISRPWQYAKPAVLRFATSNVNLGPGVAQSHTCVLHLYDISG